MCVDINSRHFNIRYDGLDLDTHIMKADQRILCLIMFIVYLCTIILSCCSQGSHCSLTLHRVLRGWFMVRVRFLDLNLIKIIWVLWTGTWLLFSRIYDMIAAWPWTWTPGHWTPGWRPILNPGTSGCVESVPSHQSHTGGTLRNIPPTSKHAASVNCVNVWLYCTVQCLICSCSIIHLTMRMLYSQL